MVPNSRKVTHKSPDHYIASTPRYREIYNISVYKWEYQRVDLWQPLRATQSVYDWACWAGNGSGPHPPTHRGDLASYGSLTIVKCCRGGPCLADQTGGGAARRVFPTTRTDRYSCTTRLAAATTAVPYGHHQLYFSGQTRLVAIMEALASQGLNILAFQDF